MTDRDLAIALRAALIKEAQNLLELRAAKLEQAAAIAKRWGIGKEQSGTQHTAHGGELEDAVLGASSG